MFVLGSNSRQRRSQLIYPPVSGGEKCSIIGKKAPRSVDPHRVDFLAWNREPQTSSCCCLPPRDSHTIPQTQPPNSERRPVGFKQSHFCPPALLPLSVPVPCPPPSSVPSVRRLLVCQRRRITAVSASRSCHLFLKPGTGHSEAQHKAPRM